MTSTEQRRHTEAELEALAPELADAAATTLGSPPGQRITHHKGIVLAGTFTATRRARELSRASHLQGPGPGHRPVLRRLDGGCPVGVG